jgi:hypothetical protein
MQHKELILMIHHIFEVINEKKNFQVYVILNIKKILNPNP